MVQLSPSPSTMHFIRKKNAHSDEMTEIPNYKTNKSNIIEATYTLLIYFAAADVALRQSFRFMRRFIYLRTRVQINSSPDA